MQSRNDTVFVTGADQTFWRCLYQLLLAVERRGWRKDASWIAYDLGMAPQTRRTLETRFPWCRFRRLNLDDLGEHYVPAFGSYAWKPLIVWDVAKDAAGPVIWMDSANIPKTSPDKMIDWIHTHGLYILRGQTALLGRCDRRMLEAMNVPGWIWGSRECASGLVGFDAGNPLVRQIAQDWAIYSADPEIIRPTVDTFEGHRNDQSVLNALIQPHSAAGQLKLPEQDIDISASRPVQFISTRNKLRPNFPLWADPLARAYYWAAKAIDQTANQIEDWAKRRAKAAGLCGQRYEIHSRRTGAAQIPHVCPIGHGYADPFLTEHDGRVWVFFTNYTYAQMRQGISATPLDDPRKPIPMQGLGNQTSHPYLVHHQGQLLMVPDDTTANAIYIYECTQFPDQWKLRRRVVEGVDAAGSILFPHDGRWWVFTSLSSPQPERPHRYLAIFHTDDPVKGDWTAHPINAQGRYITSITGAGRNAGGILHHEGKLLRTVLGDPNTIDQDIAFREITTLTPDSFEDHPTPSPDHLSNITSQQGVNHLSPLSDVVIWQQRTQ